MRPVSNTTPLIHLARIGELELLRDLYGGAVVPPAVLREAEPRIGGVVTAAITEGWMVEQAPVNLSYADELERVLGGRGEAEAIALAAELPDAILLIDERAARNMARARGLHVRGSLGILLDGKRQGRLAAVRPYLDRLRATGFWLDDRTYAAVLQAADERL